MGASGGTARARPAAGAAPPRPSAPPACLAVFGATGALGQEVTWQALAAGHTVRALVRTPAKLPAGLRERVEVVEGDALRAADVDRVLAGADHVLFALGVDKASPENLCTDVTRLILERLAGRRFIWCGGGSNRVEGDPDTFGPRFVRWWANSFLGLRHRDKEHQLALLLSPAGMECEWFGVRPLQMGQSGVRQEHTGVYRLGMHSFSGMSKISFADCADAMLTMLGDDTWRHQAPIVQY